MAPSWVLLNRIVHFGEAIPAAAGGTSKDGEGFAGGASMEGAAIGGSGRALSPREAMATLKPYPVIVAPPEATSLYMVLGMPLERLGLGVVFGEISSTDKGVMVLYSGSYRPGNGGFSGDGCYLVYDASNNVVSAIPPLPDSSSLKINDLGRSAVVSCHGGSEVEGYRLAELITTHDRGLPEAVLCLWSPSSSTVSHDGEWILKPIRLPLPAHLCGPTYLFEIDMAFSYAGCFCWVDLFTGVLVCDLSAPQGPKFSFIPLPEGYSMDVPYNRRLRMKPEMFRSMGCVSGTIKFVALVDYTNEACPSNEVMLKTWTLASDFKDWKECKALCIGDLWASEGFNEMGLPHVVPMCPVLSMNEDEVIYAILNDIEEVDDVDEFGDINEKKNLVPKAHYRIRLDMRQNKILSSTKSSTCSLAWLTPNLLASEFNAYLEDSKDHQREEEASHFGAKRVKY